MSRSADIDAALDRIAAGIQQTDSDMALVRGVTVDVAEALREPGTSDVIRLCTASHIVATQACAAHRTLIERVGACIGIGPRQAESLTQDQLVEALRDHLRRLFDQTLVTIEQHPDREDPEQWWMESFHGMIRVSDEFGEAWTREFGPGNTNTENR